MENVLLLCIANMHASVISGEVHVLWKWPPMACAVPKLLVKRKKYCDCVIISNGVELAVSPLLLFLFAVDFKDNEAARLKRNLKIQRQGAKLR